ncbi:MAG: hypothetical protein HY896_05235 [Deltaproteobacteria bacterium]|nr:hypothetical protein [Deltaproteobacteria bacterium]
MIRSPDFLKFMRGFASHNLWLKAVALLLAVVLWWFVAGESKVQVGFAVPLEIRNIPRGMTIMNKVERQVEVRLAGPPSLLGGVKQADVSASIDLCDARFGRQVVRIEEQSIRVPPGVKVQRIYPNAVDVWLERLERRRIPVIARINGGSGTRRKVAKVQIVPASLEVEALPEEFSRLKNLTVNVTVPDENREAYTANARVDLRDGHAKILGNPEVMVTVQFRR